MADLEKLAKRAVIDTTLHDNKEQLCQDLGNMLHMMEQLLPESAEKQSESAINTTNYDADPAVLLYDVPRGVTEAPCRDDTALGDDENLALSVMSASVRGSLLEPKMKRVGAHQYFEIVTARQK